MSAPVFSISTTAPDGAVSVQPSLFAEEELALLTIDQPEARKHYTAESLAKNIAKRDAIVRALAEGHGLLRIARAFGVSHHLVSTLRDSRPDLVAIEKKQLSGQIGRILKMSADRFEEALANGVVPAGQIPVAFGIFADKRAQLDGEAGMIVEHRLRIVGTAEGFRAKLQAAVDSAATGNQPVSKQKEIVLDAEVVADTSALPSPAPLPPPATGGGGCGAASSVAATDPYV